MTQQSDLATMFELSGEGVKLSYYINEDNSSQLDYQDANTNVSFAPGQVHIQQSDLGSLITVTLKGSAGSSSTTFTLVLPQVKLGGQTEQPLQTFGVITQHTSGSAVGAQLSYRVVQLQGKGAYTDY